MKIKSFVIVEIIVCIISWGCHESSLAESYNYIDPKYDLIKLEQSTDSIHFPLDENTYNSIKSFNTFVQKGVEFVSFYDSRSQTINIYEFNTQKIKEKIDLKSISIGNRLYKTTVYVKTLDSIFICNETKLYMIDSSGAIKKSIDYLSDPPLAWAAFENTCPPLFEGDKIFTGVRPYVNETSLNALSKWKVLYQFNLTKNEAFLHYNLPRLYKENFFGYHFLDYSYCINSKGNFVFSFPADSTIYETNLKDYNEAYWSKSKFQKTDISPVRKSDLLKNEGKMQYAIRDSYGPIFFDKYNRRYLRLARQKINSTEYSSKNRRKRQSVIILDEKFRIIGESEVKNNVAFSSLLIASNGNIYIADGSNDEHYLNFIRFVYK